MATVFLTLRGDQIGRFSSLRGTGNGAERVVTLRDVAAIGSADEIFTIRVDQVNNGQTEFRNGQFVTILDSNGAVVMSRTGIQPDIQQGLGGGDQHLIISNSRFYINLTGVPAQPETVLITNEDRNGILSLGDNDGALDFTDTRTTFPCFCTGTLIDTPRGPVACETLTAGDLVQTSGGVERVLWAGMRTLLFPPCPHSERPVLIRANAFGRGVPARDVRVSPQHRVAFGGPVVSDLFGCNAVLVPAKALLALPGVRQMGGCKAVTYVTILLARHSVMTVEGAPMESLYPGPQALLALGTTRREEVFGLLPDLESGAADAYGPHAHPPITVREGERLVAAMLANRSRPRLLPAA